VKLDVYGGRDPREIPAYPISDVAWYLRLPESTLRSWTLGQSYPTSHGRRRSQPLIQIASLAERIMSFEDLIEAHVLSSLRRRHAIPLSTIRKAVARIRRENPNSEHPLADFDFATNGVELFLEEVDRITNLSQDWQLVLRETIEGHLKRIDRAPQGFAVRLYPFTRPEAPPDTPRKVMIDPRIAFGRPVITGTGVKTATVFERFSAGDSPEDLADDYDRQPEEIWEAIRWESARAA
jgi:uncharacterized protein (DUF433 family)